MQTCSPNLPDVRELPITWQHCLDDGVVEGRSRTFGLEVILQSLDNIIQEHAHNLTPVSLHTVQQKSNVSLLKLQRCRSALQISTHVGNHDIILNNFLGMTSGVSKWRWQMRLHSLLSMHTFLRLDYTWLSMTEVNKSQFHGTVVLSARWCLQWDRSIHL